jgi:DNA-binding NtrC family response regulator
VNVIPISLPPLRDRREDIPLLAGHFLNRYAVKYKRSNLRLSPDQEEMLGRYPWPGNLRELKNTMERAVLLSVADQLERESKHFRVGISGGGLQPTPWTAENSALMIRRMPGLDGKEGAPEGGGHLAPVVERGLDHGFVFRGFDH